MKFGRVRLEALLNVLLCATGAQLEMATYSNTTFTVLGDSSYPCYLVITFKSFH